MVVLVRLVMLLVSCSSLGSHDQVAAAAVVLDLTAG